LFHSSHRPGEYQHFIGTPTFHSYQKAGPTIIHGHLLKEDIGI